MELNLLSLFGLLVHSCTNWLRPLHCNPPPAFRLLIRGRYWSLGQPARKHDIYCEHLVVAVDSENGFILTLTKKLAFESLSNHNPQCFSFHCIVHCKHTLVYRVSVQYVKIVHFERVECSTVQLVHIWEDAEPCLTGRPPLIHHIWAYILSFSLPPPPSPSAPSSLFTQEMRWHMCGGGEHFL